MTNYYRDLAAWFRVARNRRRAYGVAAIIALIFCFLPRPYVARAKIVPQDTSATAASTTALLGALGSGSQSIGSLLTGGRPSNDLYLLIGRSDSVALDVIHGLNLVGPNGYATADEAKIALDRKVDVHSLLGGAMEVETTTHDPQMSERLTEAYVTAISKQLALFGKQIIINKQRIVETRFAGAMKRVAEAERELNVFRRTNNLADPETQLGTELAMRAQLQGQLMSKSAELEAMQVMKGPESPEVMATKAEMATMRQQIAKMGSPSVSPAGPNVSRISEILTTYLNLYRNYRFAEANYAVYAKSLEQVEVEQLAAESASYVQIIDPAHLDAQRHFNVWAVATLVAIMLLAAFTELYVPLTGLTNPAKTDQD